MRALKTSNLALAFLTELGAFAAFAYWGANEFDGAAAVLAAVAAPVAAIALWARFAAPRAPRRLAPALRIPFQLVIFGLAVAALITADNRRAALTLGAAAAINALLATMLGQWAE